MNFQEATKEQKETAGLFYIYKKPAAQKGALPLVLLLHGRTGNEQFIWQFSKCFTATPAIIIAPRAPVDDPDGGYTWWEIGDRVNKCPGTPFVTTAMINAGIGAIESFIGNILKEFSIDETRIFAVGFSQGAMAGSYLSLVRPRLFYGMGLLSSALPVVLNPDIESPEVDKGGYRTNYFIAHGSADRIIEIRHACRTSEILKARGHSVEMVVDETSHKVGTKGMSALRNWFERIVF